MNYILKTRKILKNSWIKSHPSHSTTNLQHKEQVNIALDKISPPWVQTDPTHSPECSENHFFDIPFDITELNVALETKKTGSAPGPDGANFEILQSLPIKFKLLFLDNFNEMFLLNNYPQSWKQSFIHFITKPDGNSFRPIALTCVCKLFETMVKNRLQWWVEHHHLLTKCQQGFR